MQKRATVRTDLALERMRAPTDIAGVFYEEKNEGKSRLSYLRVESEEGASAIGQPCGNYLTFQFESADTLSETERRSLSCLLAEKLSLFTRGACKSAPRRVLIVGLGNRRITADAVGPLSVDRIHATGHLEKEDASLFSQLGCCSLTTFAPGAMSETGVESARLVAAAVAATDAELVVAIDALAARSPARLATTIQLCDTGIRPGAGVGNHRSAIDLESIGVPVLAIGTPTVVDTETLLLDAFEEAGTDPPPDLAAVLPKRRSSFVSYADADALTDALSDVISDACNRAYGILL